MNRSPVTSPVQDPKTEWMEPQWYSGYLAAQSLSSTGHRLRTDSLRLRGFEIRFKQRQHFVKTLNRAGFVRLLHAAFGDCWQHPNLLVSLTKLVQILHFGMR